VYRLGCGTGGTEAQPLLYIKEYGVSVDCGSAKTSFLPNFINKTTAVATKTLYPVSQPQYLIKNTKAAAA
jgi:hypothetical protein